MMPFDQPTIDQVLQEEEPFVAPVYVRNIVRTNEMPCDPTYNRVVLGTGAKAVPLFNEDPQRKHAVVWGDALGTGIDCICIGTRDQADNFSGAMLFVTSAAVPLRYEIPDRRQVWARGVVLNQSSGTFTGFTPCTDDVIVSVIDCQWAR